MSIYVIREVLKHSRAEYGERLVMVALADGASKDDAVTWIDQRTIMELARLSERGVRDSLRALEEMVEIETRVFRRGRAWRNAYRVLVGDYEQVEVDHENLPFTLRQPFSRPADVAARKAARLDALAAAGVAAEHHARAADSAGRSESVGRQSAAGSGGNLQPVLPADPSALTRARGSLLDPEGEPERTQQQGGGGVLVDAAVAGLERQLRRLRVAPAKVAEAIADRDRAQAWLELARRAATDNVAGFFVTGFESGEWPAERGAVASTGVRHLAAKEASLRTLVSHGAVDEARHLIHVEWDTLASAERASLDELVDELLSDRLPDAAAAERERGAA